MSSTELTAFEKEILNDLLDTTFWKYKGDVIAITPEQCKQGLLDKYASFDFNSIYRMEKAVSVLDRVDQLPTTLIALACDAAWKSVNWVNVANSVKAELSDYWVNEV